MKILLIVAALVVCIQAASVPQTRDWSKIKPRVPQFGKSFTVQGSNQLLSSTLPTNPRSYAGVCGKSNPPGPGIVGGDLAGAHEFPWQAALFITVGSQTYFCGGSLIGDEWVLTAAHCAEGASSFEIILGAQNIHLSDADEPDRITLVSESFTIHPNWNPLLARNDLALVRLPQKVQFSDIIAPNCLPPLFELNQHVGESAIASGWGRDSENATTITDLLRKANLTIISNTECRATFGVSVTATTLCTSGISGVGICDGDSGGPLSLVNSEGIYTQVGIVSYGYTGGCGKGYPDAYVRITEYVDWITSITGITA